DRFIDRTRDFEETEILETDQLSIQQLALDKAVPVVPVVAPGSLKAEDWLRIALPGLGERQDFEAFIVGPKSAGKECNGIGFLLKDEFSCKEILESAHFRIVCNCRIGPLFKGQHDFPAEAVPPTGSLLGGTHDPTSPACDDHEALFHDSAAKIEGNLV